MNDYGFGQFLLTLETNDLWPRIVDGRVVLHGNQANVTDEIRMYARKYLDDLKHIAEMCIDTEGTDVEF